MGMYHSLRCQVRLKPAFVPVIEMLYEVNKEDAQSLQRANAWKRVAAAFPQYHFLEFYSREDRAIFIPFGSLGTVPAEWRSGPEGLDGDIWSIVCSTKNRETMEMFIDTVLAPMTLEVRYCMTFYEEDPHETVRVLPNLPMIALHNDIEDALEEESRAGAFFSCSSKCKDGGDHQWDGPGLETETSSSATCSRCGIDAMTVSLWEGP